MMILLLLLSQLCLVAAQVLIKRGLNGTNRAAFLAAGIAFMTGWFLLWTGLLRSHDLSLIYPFQGLSPVLMVVASALFLRERPTWRSAFGVVLIGAGTALVGVSGPAQ
jgi:drug/metabolite transporter (DMT)-like permease